MESPILFLIFNRIEITKKSFDVIRSVKPPKLYIAADGPRSNFTNESEICDIVREIATNIDWDCDVKTLFQENNLGCRKGVITGINWFFQNESQGIILEDDVIPKIEFFEFCDIMLNKYRNHKNIYSILGFNQFGQGITSNTYFFSRGYYPWGWATWKSRWELYDEFSIDIKKLDDDSLKRIYNKSALDGIKFNLKLINAGLLDTWDYQMIYMIILQKGYTVVPYANLTTNIGTNGAHSDNNKKIDFNYGYLDVNQLVHPKMIEDDVYMNKKLWNEYEDAILSVKFKTILFNLNLYSFSKYLYKKFKKLFN